jgi:hypothetical protein
MEDAIPREKAHLHFYEAAEAKSASSSVPVVDTSRFRAKPMRNIGVLVDQTSLTVGVRDTLEAEVRQFLSIQPPLIVDIHPEQVSVALYEEDTLPLFSTRVWSLADPDLTAPALMEHLK